MEQLTAMKIAIKSVVKEIEKNREEYKLKLDESLKALDGEVFGTIEYYEINGGVKFFEKEIVKCDAKLHAYGNTLDMIQEQINQTEMDLYIQFCQEKDIDYSFESLFNLKKEQQKMTHPNASSL